MLNKKPNTTSEKKQATTTTTTTKCEKKKIESPSRVTDDNQYDKVKKLEAKKCHTPKMEQNKQHEINYEWRKKVNFPNFNELSHCS